MVRHFHCTACGKCCHGQLPLTCKDALANATRFPLCFVWTPLRQGSKDYPLVATLGTTIKLADRKELAVLIVPTAYLPSSFPCPALGEDNLCGIHNNKPSRCKTMPFYPYRAERYQADLLTPRPGWACDTSTSASVVFENNKIVFRDDFDHERQELLEQVPILRRYAEYMLKYSPSLINSLMHAASKTKAGHVVTSLSSFLTATKSADAKKIAQQQLPILKTYVEKTAGLTQLADFYRNYLNWSKEMAYLSQRQE
jgi:Fe-S-cluster containining protein